MPLPTIFECAVLSQYRVFRDTTPETLLAIEHVNEYITDVTDNDWARIWRETCGTSQTARDLHSTTVHPSSKNGDGDDPAPPDYREIYLQWRQLESAKKTDLAARLRNAYKTSSSLTKRVQTTAVTRGDMLGKRKWGSLNPPAGSGAAQIKRARIQAQERRCAF
ncbi:hypothetical protein GGF31_008524 [Allomyces arbusculus]|nr:hypothetical protein GGF31_008524 [Allomyces arbusculus]